MAALGANEKPPAEPIPELPQIELPTAPDPSTNPAGYLRSIYAVREQSKKVMERVWADDLNHFNVNVSKQGEIARYVSQIIKVRSSATYMTDPFDNRLI